MKYSSTLILVALAALFGLSSCVKRDYYAEPGYQFVFSDDFNSDINHWSFSDFQNHAFVDISNGELHYDYHPNGTGTNTVAVTTGMPLYQKSFDIRTRFISNNAMAMVFGVSAEDYGYSFFIDKDGSFALYDEGTSRISPEPIISWTKSNAIRQGWNDVELQSTQSGAWIGYINGVEVFHIPAHNLYGSQTGFMVLNNTSGDAEYLDQKW